MLAQGTPHHSDQFFVLPFSLLTWLAQEIFTAATAITTDSAYKQLVCNAATRNAIDLAYKQFVCSAASSIISDRWPC